RLGPQRGLRERARDATVEIVLDAEDLETPGDVVVDRLRERVRPLKDHADVPAHGDGVDVRPRDVLPVVANRPALAETGDEVVHAVEAADERALAAAGRTDDRRDEVAVHLHRDALQGGLAA